MTLAENTLAYYRDLLVADADLVHYHTRDIHEGEPPLRNRVLSPTSTLVFVHTTSDRSQVDAVVVAISERAYTIVSVRPCTRIDATDQAVVESTEKLCGSRFDTFEALLNAVGGRAHQASFSASVSAKLLAALGSTRTD